MRGYREVMHWYQDYEEPEPPAPWERMRCARGHFMKTPVTTRGWVEDGSDEDGAPKYRPALEHEPCDEAEIWCPTCKGWFRL